MRVTMWALSLLTWGASAHPDASRLRSRRANCRENQQRDRARSAGAGTTLSDQRHQRRSATKFTPLNALSDGGWFGASVDLSMGSSWYLLLSDTRDRIGLDRTQVLYCSLMLRF